MTIAKCPSCPNTYPINPRAFGKMAKCNSCGHVFILTDPDLALFESQEPGASPTSPTPASVASDRPVRPLETWVATENLPCQIPMVTGGSNRKPAGTGLAFAIIALAVIVALRWLPTHETHTSSAGTVRNTTPSSAVQLPNAIPESSRYTEADAHRAIRSERSRYAVERLSALSADRLKQEENRWSEVKLRWAEIEAISKTIRNRENDLFKSSFAKPIKPSVNNANEQTRQAVIDYIRDFRAWGDSHRALCREIFSLQDEAHRIFALAYTSVAHPLLPDRGRDILTRSIFDLADPFPSTSDDPVVQMYREAVRAVQEEQWSLELELQNTRIAEIEEAKKAAPAHTPRDSTVNADVAAGPWRLQRVVDGDTIAVSVGNSGHTEIVRLLNIDTPEKGQPGHLEATAALETILEYRPIQLEFENSDALSRDRYGRVLAFVFTDEKLVNYEMIKRGWTNLYSDYGRGRYASPLEFAEADARANRRGLHR
jgi:endonuclease YncB( thermonuclease family)